MNTTAIGKYISWGIIGVSVILILIFLIAAMGSDASPAEVVESNSYIVWYNYVLVGLAGALVLGFFIIEMVTNSKLLINALISLLVVAVVGLISFLLASDEIPQFVGAEKFNITASTSKIVGTSIIGIYVFLGLAVAGIIYAEISKLLK